MEQGKLVNFYINKEIYDELKRIGKIQGRTVSELIREAVCLLIMKYNKYPEKEDTSNDFKEGGNK